MIKAGLPLGKTGKRVAHSALRVGHLPAKMGTVLIFGLFSIEFFVESGMITVKITNLNCLNKA